VTLVGPGQTAQSVPRNEAVNMVTVKTFQTLVSAIQDGLVPFVTNLFVGKVRHKSTLAVPNYFSPNFDNF